MGASINKPSLFGSRFLLGYLSGLLPFLLNLLPPFCWDFKFVNHIEFRSVADAHEPCEHSPPWSWVPGTDLHTNSSEGALGAGSAA